MMAGQSILPFHFVAGLGSGILSAILLQPADLLKTRVQQSGSASLRSVIRDISRQPQPLREFWRGTLPSTLRTGIGSALYFSTLNALRQYVAASTILTSSSQLVATSTTTTTTTTTLSEEQQQPSSSSSSSKMKKKKNHHHSSSLPVLSNLANLTTGAIARGSVGFVMMPITVIKVRYESNLYAYRSIWGACSDIVRREGVRGLFVGFGATAARDAPYAGLYVLFYEQCKKRLSLLAQKASRSSSDDGGGGGGSSMKGGKSAGINFVSSVVAAGLATAITNPFDAVKTRIQLLPKKYGNMFVAARRMVREDGWRSLMDGLGLRMARKAMSSALAWTLYEELIRRAERRWVDDDGQVVV